MSSSLTDRLDTAAVISIAAGAAGAVGLFLHASHRKGSVPSLLVVLFIGWVLTPFVVLLLGRLMSKGWPALTRTALSGITLVVAIASLLVYGAAALGPADPKTAVFVLVAPASWLLTAIVVSIAAFMSRRKN